MRYAERRFLGLLRQEPPRRTRLSHSPPGRPGSAIAQATRLPFERQDVWAAARSFRMLCGSIYSLFGGGG